jgi:hypothetical protein
MTWNLGEQMSARLGKGSNIRPAPHADKQEEPVPTPASPEGGFGGGVQSAAVPKGESFGDQVRRRVFG